MTTSELRARRRAYHQYLQSPEARIEKILDQIEEERFKHEQRETEDIGYKGMRELARRAWRD